MISNMKRITVHGPATHLNLTAFKFNGDEPILDRAGFGKNDYIGVLDWGPTTKFYFDNPKGYAPSATDSDDYVLNGAVQEILNRFDELPNECHIEVARNGKNVGWSEGLQFK